MALSEADFAEIEALLARPEVDRRVLADLRARFPSLSFTLCDASDVDAEEPFRQYGAFSLHLVDAADHCLRLTLDPERATGLVLARKAARP
jgi:hypothetical protein